MAEEQFSYNRDAIAKSMTKYYETLAKACYFSPSDIQHPPPGGWTDADLDVDALRALRRSDKAIDLLRHIPYLKPWKDGGQQVVQWPVLVRSRAIRYLRADGDFSTWSSRGEDGLAELSALPLDQTPAAPTADLPPDAVALTRGYDSGFVGKYWSTPPWCIVDCGTGVLRYHASDLGFDGGKSWTRPEQDPASFFGEITTELTGCGFVALPPVEGYGPELMASDGNFNSDLKTHLEFVYETFGWRDVVENPAAWRRAECFAKLRRIRVWMREAEKKRKEFEHSFEDPDDGDYEDVDMDSGDDDEAASSDGSGDEGAPDRQAEDVEDLGAEVAELKAEPDEPDDGYDFRGNDLPSYDYDRDAVVDVIKRYYELLSRMAYFPPSHVEHPPEGGWPDDQFPSEKLRTLGYADKAADLLRHLPYLGYDEHVWELPAYSVPVRYLRDANPFISTPDRKLQRRLLYKHRLCPYKKLALPPEVVTIWASKEGSVFGTWYMVDTERGVLYVERLADRKGFEPLGSQPWLRGDAGPIVPYFEGLIARTRSLELVPVPGLDPEVSIVPGIWAEPDWELGALLPAKMGGVEKCYLLPDGTRWGIEDARNVYLEHGWPDLEKFRREECIKVLADLHHRLVYPRKTSTKDDDEDDDIEMGW